MPDAPEPRAAIAADLRAMLEEVYNAVSLLAPTGTFSMTNHLARRVNCGQRLKDHADRLEKLLDLDGQLGITEDGRVVRLERVPDEWEVFVADDGENAIRREDTAWRFPADDPEDDA